MENKKAVKGYKVFNSDWTCRGFQYEVGKTYTEDVEPRCCDSGFHFCTKISDCFNYYQFDSDNRVAEVEALGDVNEKGDKSCTNKIKIVREVSWAEVLELANAGNANAGDDNSGNANAGNDNSGIFNTSTPPMRIFDTETTMTWEEWDESQAKKILKTKRVSTWEYWWCRLSDKEKAIIKNIPNFDAEKFYQITGIEVEEVAE